MIYVIHNITHTSDDRHRRGHRLRDLRKGRVQIGPRTIDEGRSASISASMYAQHKERIDHYVSIGMVRVQILAGPKALAVPAPTAPSTVVAEPAAQDTAPDMAEAPAAPEGLVTEVTRELVSEVTLSAIEEDDEDPVSEGPAEPTPAESASSKRRGRPPKEK